MKQFVSWGILVLFLAGLLAGAAGCAGGDSSHQSSKKRTYEEKREGSGGY